MNLNAIHIFPVLMESCQNLGSRHLINATRRDARTGGGDSPVLQRFMSLTNRKYEIDFRMESDFSWAESSTSSTASVNNKS